MWTREGTTVFRSTVLVAVGVCALTGCGERVESPNAGYIKSPKTTAKEKWPLQNVQTMPAEIVVLSGTSFRCGSVPCRLLGVKESTDPGVREQAAKFARLWFKSVGNYIGIYNDSNPLMADDGTAIVWIAGYDSHLSRLNEELIRAGLAEIDSSREAVYSFTVLSKQGHVVCDWLGDLRKANEAHESGEAPHVLFDWPTR